MFLGLFILRGHSTREAASGGRVTYFILRVYTGTMSATANSGKIGRGLGMQVNGLEG